MKEFLKRLFAVIGVLSTLALLLLVGAGWYLFSKRSEESKPPESMVLAIDFDDKIVESLTDFRASLPKLIYGDEEETPLLHILRALELAKNDPKIKGVMARFGSERPDMVHAQEIVAALDAFRATGKFSYVYAPSYGDFGQGGSIYSLASHFDNIWLQPIGAVALSPLSIEAPFGKTALGKLGVETDFMRREDFKSVMENVSRDSFSPPVKANMLSMLSNLSEQMAKSIADGRKIEITKARDIVANGPYTSQEALKLGLVTKLAYADEFYAELEKVAGKDTDAVGPTSYLYYYGKAHNQKPKARIAVIYADGLITDNPPKGPSRVANDEVIDTQDVVDGLEAAAEDKEVKAILLRVNSPGGSPVASETIRRAVIKAKESKKPVFVSMGRVAASGGYWIAMNADRIIADPATITGSIGVVAGKFVLGGLFDKLGVKWDTVSETNTTNMWSIRLPFNDKGRARINTMLDETYDAFTKNVAEARNIPLEKMPEIAKGRVFTGEQALAIGLVDEIGGMNVALEALKKQLNLKPEDKISLYQFPAPETPSSLILRILHNLKSKGLAFGDFDQLQQIKSMLSPYLQTLLDDNVISAKLPPYFAIGGI